MLVLLLGTLAPVLGSTDGAVGLERSDWEFDGAGQWLVRDGRLTLIDSGHAGYPVRRPHALAVLRGDPIGPLSLSMRIRSTAPESLTTRDLVVIFGYQGPLQFYYAHLSARVDDVHTGIFLVDGADRRRIDSAPRYAPLTDSEWHRLRIERDPGSGSIAVYFDDDPQPLTTARDRTLGSGRVGLGSFDDSGEFAEVRLQLRPRPITPPSIRATAGR